MAAKPEKLDPRKTESQVSEQVVQAAAMLGIALERRNTGAGVNPSGRVVRFGSVGGADWHAVLPDGRHLDVEIKREGFDPSTLRGEKKAHFDRQLARLQKTNELGGVAFWVDDAAEFLSIMRLVLRGARVVEPGCGRPEVHLPRP